MQIYNLISYYAKKMGETARFFIKSHFFHLLFRKKSSFNDIFILYFIGFEYVIQSNRF